MKVKVKKLNENAVIPFKTYERDFCYDVVAVSEEEVAPNVWKYGIGLAFQIDRDSLFGIDILICPLIYAQGVVFGRLEWYLVTAKEL